MFHNINCLFEDNENKTEFELICEKLKHHPFPSPWGKPSTDNNLFDFYLTETTVEEMEISHSIQQETHLLHCSSKNNKEVDETSEPLDEKLVVLKESLMTIQDPHAIQEVKGIEVLYSLTLNEVPQFCEALKIALIEDESLALFINSVLKIEKPLSLSVASSLVNHTLYPLGFKSNINSSRNLLASILKFTEVYPKAIIDEVILPCLKNNHLAENHHLETLMKMTKSYIPNECISYLMKRIFDSALPSDNTFSILQGIIERKNELDQALKDSLAWKLKSWSADHSSSVKFTKLVISILNVYGSELSNQLMTYSEIVEENKTIMKRAAESVLKKLKKM